MSYESYEKCAGDYELGKKRKIQNENRSKNYIQPITHKIKV
jgi:hypothetical protein